MAIQTVPVTIVSGFSGAGKSTLIEHLRTQLAGERLHTLTDSGEDDLLAEVDDAANMHGASAIVIECAAALEPYFTVENLLEGDEESPPPTNIRVDTLVTVIDASRFLRDVLGAATLQDLSISLGEEDNRTISELLIEQVEYADAIIINKIDRIDQKSLERLDTLLERLNPRAQRFHTQRAQVPAENIINARQFDLDETDDGAGWLAELQGFFAEEEDSAGVSSFTYVERRPFHPARFNELLSEFRINGLVRAKGSLWVASRHHEIGVWSIAGQASSLAYGGAWFASTPTREWPQDEAERLEIMQEWVPPFGDRRQEIAFIGIDMNHAEIRERLDRCLLTSDEMKDGPDSWYALPDPLPDWHEEEANW